MTDRSNRLLENVAARKLLQFAYQFTQCDSFSLLKLEPTITVIGHDIFFEYISRDKNAFLEA
jgi:hypothetical protein